jgi:signal peptidase
MTLSRAFSSLCADLLRDGTAVRFTATGSSMWPTIRDGDVITVVPARASELAVGDVVLYETPRGLTAHRVIRRVQDAGESLRVRGDTPGSTDEVVGRRQLLGRVGAVERDGRGRPLGDPGCVRRLAWRIAAGFRSRGPARMGTGGLDSREINHSLERARGV